MPMDGFTLSYMRRELLSALRGGRVDKVNQPERDALVLLIRSGGGNHRLLLSANANQARAQLTAQAYENPAEPPMFCMLMRKHLLGARVKDVGQVAGDRILTIAFDCLDELGDSVEKTLYLEVMGRHSNLTLVREDGVIIDAIRHVNSEMSRVRTVQPGGVYQLPPQQGQAGPGKPHAGRSDRAADRAGGHAGQGADGLRRGHGQRVRPGDLRPGGRGRRRSRERAGPRRAFAPAGSGAAGHSRRARGAL